MSLHNNFEQLHPYAKSKVFKNLFGIKWRADRMLSKRKPGQWRVAARVIDGWISEWIESSVKEATEEFIQRHSERLSTDGGWELGYLSRDPYDPYQSSDPATLGEIRHLLENWPIEADDRPDFPSDSDYEDLDALSQILSSGYPYDDIDGFPKAHDAELYAVLTLIKVDSAASFFQLPEEKKTDAGIPIYRGQFPWKTPDLIAAGNLVIEAMEIICFAERELSNAQFDKMRLEQKVHFEAQIRIEARKENAKRGALARLATDPGQKEKAMVFECWDRWKKQPNRYSRNAAFARDILSKYENLVSQRVIERWCLEWDRELASTVRTHQG